MINLNFVVQGESSDSSESFDTTKPKLAPFDKSKLFTKMNNIFATDTQKTIKKRDREKSSKKLAKKLAAGDATTADVKLLPKIAKDVRQKKGKAEDLTPPADQDIMDVKPVKVGVETNDVLEVDESTENNVAPVLSKESDINVFFIDETKVDPVQTKDEEDLPPPILEKQVSDDDSKPPVLEIQEPMLATTSRKSPVKLESSLSKPAPVISMSTQMSPVEQEAKPAITNTSSNHNQSLLKVVLTTAPSPKKSRSRKNSLDAGAVAAAVSAVPSSLSVVPPTLSAVSGILSTVPGIQSAVPGTETPLSAMPESIEAPPVIASTLPGPVVTPTSTASSDLTKSLRKVRLNKKSPTKQLSNKDGNGPPQITSLVQSAGPILTPIPVGSTNNIGKDSLLQPPRITPVSSPTKGGSVGPGGAGTEIFDFTDDEDIPLNHIDIEALNEVRTKLLPWSIAWILLFTS